MNILYIAYSCLPNKGSEEKIGWNVPVQSAKTNQVCVLTKEEHRDTIEVYLRDHKIENIKFYYADIPGIYKKVFKGAAYAIRLNIWHKRAFSVAKEICKKEKIDLIHQITPIEFRSIGDYGKIPNTRFVCGPLGGGEFLPDGLKSYAKRDMIIEWLRAGLNKWYRLKYKLCKRLDLCDYVFFANKETQAYLAELVQNVPSSLIFDNGIDESDCLAQEKVDEEPHAPMAFLVSGRIAYRKGHRFLLDALARIPKDVNYRCRIVGGGPELERVKTMCHQYGLDDRVTFTGRIPFADMEKEYENADVLIMPSIRETTGAVLLEAMSKGLPVITINQFGGPVLIDDQSGWLYSGNTREEYVESLQAAIMECVANPKEVSRRGKNAIQIAAQNVWSQKTAVYHSVYRSLVS